MNPNSKAFALGLLIFFGSLWGGALALHYLDTFWLSLAAFVTALIGLALGGAILLGSAAIFLGLTKE
jgi:hypothetical protein